MQAIAGPLSFELLEENCRMLVANDVSKLTSDNTGKLESVWFSSLRNDEEVHAVAQAILRTLQGVESQMKLNPPICFFTSYGGLFNCNHSYREILQKLKVSPELSQNQKLQTAIQGIIAIYQSIDFAIQIPGKVLTDEQRFEMNAYVQQRMFSTSKGAWDQNRKTSHVLFTVTAVQKEVNRDEMRGFHLQNTIHVESVLSGIWRLPPLLPIELLEENCQVIANTSDLSKLSSQDSQRLTTVLLYRRYHEIWMGQDAILRTLHSVIREMKRYPPICHFSSINNEKILYAFILKKIQASPEYNQNYEIQDVVDLALKIFQEL